MFGYYTTVILVVSVIISALSYVQLLGAGVFDVQTQMNNVSPRTTVKFTRRSGSVNNKGKENVRINFDLDADLSSLFNWNTKQVFVYLTAEYNGGAKREDISNKVTFWDKIIVDKKDSVLKLRNQRGAYSVYDVQKSFK